jgi:eukaryotic-like serine/threonine-protein kinase
MSGSDEDDSEVGRLVGTTVSDKYRIDRLIGRGGMGAVYQATHLAIGKRVALKFLDRQAARDSDSATRFQREAEAASAVESAHIVHIFDSGLSDGVPFLVMELLSGEDLRGRLRREGRLPLDDALRITAQVLRALSRAHEAGIIHRDLKPDNVFLCQRDDDAMFVKIVDFGISKLARRATADTLTRRGTVLGTAFYMSPEQAQAFRDIDGRTDLFSLGAILFEMLAGRPPHVGTAYEAVLINICTKDADDVRDHADDVPEAVAAVIKKALARERNERFQTAEAFYDALAASAPHIVDTSARTRVLPALSKPASSSGDRGVAGNSSRDAAFGTAGGTAVRSSSTDDARAARRRTIVTALIAALGAFVVTAFWMAKNAGQGPDPLAEQPALAAKVVATHTATAEPDPSAEPSAAGSATPTVSPMVSANAHSADAGNAKTRTAARPVAVRGTVKPGAKPSGGDGRTPQAPVTANPGVANKLKLNTEGP